MALSHSSQQLDRFYIWPKINGVLRKVAVKDICWIESDKKKF